jgi:hypothetical protein
MNCRDFERVFLQENSSPNSGLPPEAEKHLSTCSLCHDLVGAFRKLGDDENASSALTGLAGRLSADLLPADPLAPNGFYLAIFAGLFASTVAFGVYREGTFALHAMTLAQTVSILSALGACALILAWSLVRQMVPGSRHRFRPEFVPAVVIAGLSLVVAVLFRAGGQTLFWQQGWACLRMGFPFALLAGPAVWLVLRRGAILSPRVAGAAAGLLAGLAGTSVLEIHCPNLDLSHIVVWHLGVSVLASLCGLGAGVLSELLTNSSVELSGHQSRDL